VENQKLKRVALVGNPNVGKSSLFYRLTGTHVITGNFPGTTLSVTRGSLNLSQKTGTQAYEIMDLPGLYSLSENTTTIGRGALFVLSQADIIINVLDATQLKKNLYLHMQLKSLGKPIIVALNLYDEATYHGITIDLGLLSAKLNCPVIPTISISGNGARALVKALTELETASPQEALAANEKPSWEEISLIVRETQTIAPRKKQALEYLATLSVHPLWGATLALLIFGTTLFMLFTLSSSLESTVLWLFNAFLEKPLHFFKDHLASWPMLSSFLIGDISSSPIDFGNAMGLLTTGLFIPLGQVAPPVIAFYATMGFLEDCGYLPRLAYVADMLMHRYALHGAAIIPMLMGAGCNVTGIIGTRVLDNREQRIIAATLIALTIPCASQTGFIVSMASKMDFFLTGMLFAVLMLIWHLVGLVLGKKKRDNYQELILEIPPLRMPRLRSSLRKLVHRTKNFLADAIPITIVGIAIVLLLSHTGLLEIIANYLFGWTRILWGLPQEVMPALCMGLFRKEIALTFLRAVPTLSATQAFTATLILTLWFPCVSVYAILYKEFGFKTLMRMTALMFLVSGTAGVLAYMILTTFYPPIPV